LEKWVRDNIANVINALDFGGMQKPRRFNRGLIFFGFGAAPYVTRKAKKKRGLRPSFPLCRAVGPKASDRAC
jgi:hypothetical protein